MYFVSDIYTIYISSYLWSTFDSDRQGYKQHIQNGILKHINRESHGHSSEPKLILFQ